MSVSVIVLMMKTVLFFSIIASLFAILVAMVTAGGYKKFVQVLHNNLRHLNIVAMGQMFK